MAFRAKFKLTGLELAGGNALKATFKAEYDMSIPEDQRFYDATPWGEFTMIVNNPEVIAQLHLGTQYYLDFSITKA